MKSSHAATRPLLLAYKREIKKFLHEIPHAKCGKDHTLLRCSFANKNRLDVPYWRTLTSADVGLANAHLIDLKSRGIKEQRKLKEQPQVTLEPIGADRKGKHDDTPSASIDIADTINTLKIGGSGQAKDLTEVQRRIKELGKPPVVNDTQYHRRRLLRELTTDVATKHSRVDVSDDATFYEYIFLGFPIDKIKIRLRSFIKRAVNTFPF
jgi:hypothetical protein